MTGGISWTAQEQVDGATIGLIKGPTGPTGISEAGYYLGVVSNTGISAGGTFTPTVCPYNIVSENPDGIGSWYNITTYRFTPQVAGYWRVTGSFYNFRSSTTRSGFIIRKNGTTVAADDGISIYYNKATKVIALNGTTDYIDAAYYGAASGTINQDPATSFLQFEFIKSL
jgi:hypothetical protein